MFYSFFNSIGLFYLFIFFRDGLGAVQGFLVFGGINLHSTHLFSLRVHLNSGVYICSYLYFFLSLVAIFYLTPSSLLIQPTFLIGWEFVYLLIFMLLYFYTFLVYSLMHYFLLRKQRNFGNSLHLVAATNPSSQLSALFFVFFRLFIFFTLPTLMFLVIFKGPLAFLWFAHFQICSTQLKIFSLILITGIVLFGIIFSTARVSDSSFFDFLLLICFLMNWFFFLYGASNLYTLIFCFEVLTSVLFAILITSFITLKRPSYFNALSVSTKLFKSYSHYNFFTLIIFFWISTATSIFIFFFLTIYSFFILTYDWNVVDLLFLTNTTLVTFKTYCLNTLIMLFFVVLIFFKCGLPPFVFWKSFFFLNTSFMFITLYLLLYYLYLFVYICFLLLSLSVSFAFLFNILFALTLISASILILSVFFISYTKLFLVFSSFFNSLFMLYLISILATTSLWFNFMPYLVSYLIYYNMILALLFNVMFSIAGGLPKTLSSFTLVPSNFFKKSLLLVCFFSLAGLPPLSSFFFKLHALSLLMSTTLGFALVTTLLFLLVMLFFYAQYFKFFLTQRSQFVVRSFTVLNKHTTSYFSLNSILFVFLTVGWVWLNDFILGVFWLFY